MITSVLDQITKLIGQAYLVATVVPWFVFWVANLVTAVCVLRAFPLYRVVAEYVTKTVGIAAIATAIIVVFLLVGGYLVATFNGLFKRLLEGRFTGPPIGFLVEAKIRKKARGIARLDEKIGKASVEAARATLARRAALVELQQAYNASPDRQAEPRPLDDQLVKRVVVLSGLLRGAPTVDQLREATTKLHECYRHVHPHYLEDIHSRLNDLFKSDEARAQAAYSDLRVFRQQYYGSSERPAPSDYGNVLEAANFYVADRYGMESLAFWSRLQTLVPKEFQATVEQAKTVMDFLTAMTLMALLYSALWLLVLPHLTGDWQLWVGVVVGGLLVASVFYRAAVESASTFGETLKSAFDLYRHALLDALHLERPSTPQAEKALWTKVSRYLLYGQVPADLAYVQAGPVAQSQSPGTPPPPPAPPPPGPPRPCPPEGTAGVVQ